MGTPLLQPLVFEPVYQAYPWGGRRLERLYGRRLPGDLAAESWEIADRPEGMSRVARGALQGATLAELIDRWGEDLLGARGMAAGSALAARRGETRPRFPLLLKIIDARERLSLQVHPDESSAPRVGGEPKTEMWVGLDGDPGATVLAGLRPGVGRVELERALAGDAAEVEACLCRLPLEPGGVIHVPGGRLHAIDAGCLLYEIQQNSNTTYRVHDWGRRGPGGEARPLHIEEALAVIDWGDFAPVPERPRIVPGPPGVRIQELLLGRHFHVRRIELEAALSLEGDRSGFRALFARRGGLVVAAGGEEIALAAGTSCLLPAAAPACTLLPAAAAGADILLIALG